MAKNKLTSFYRIIDANSNRAKEGLRVTEDLMRFYFKNSAATKNIKSIRHGITECVNRLIPDYNKLLDSRNSSSDVGRRSTQKSEFSRNNIPEIMISNFKRAQESLRVLEEISKLFDIKTSKKFKELRYEAYVSEKNILLKLKKK